MMDLQDYPGSRWWKFDFHCHTPASTDYDSLERERLEPRDWLLATMEAGIDCVAVTDHNNSDWIEKLGAALDELASEEPRLAGYRSLTLFPGVEITSAEGLHILGIFSPQTSKAKLDGLIHGGLTLSNPDVPNHEQMFEQSGSDVVDAIHAMGGLAIAAHADDRNGLLFGEQSEESGGVQTEEDRFKPQMAARAIKAVLGKLDALEVKRLDSDAYLHCCNTHEVNHLACVIGSDAHETTKVGEGFTWVKMSAPDFDGLKLALLDADSAIRRYDTGGELLQSDPQPLPAQWIRSVTLEHLHLRRERVGPLTLCFNPAYNAIIGGRGSGKSTVLECMRLALGRDQELRELGADSGISPAFERFRKIHSERSGPGMMLTDSKITVEVVRGRGLEALRFQYEWWLGSGNQASLVVRDWDEESRQWQDTGIDVDQARATFPVRIFSQKQILEIANKPQALLATIDDSIKEQKADWQADFDQRKATLLAARQRLRTLRTELAKKPALELEHKEASRKALVFRNSNFGPLLKAYQHATKQKRALGDFHQLLADDVAHLRNGIELAAHLPETELTDFDPQTPQEQQARDAALALKTSLVKQFDLLKQTLAGMESALQQAQSGRQESDWFKANQAHIDDYRKETERLKAEGIQSAEQASIAVAAEERLKKQLDRLKGYQQQLEQAEKDFELAAEALYQWREKLTGLREQSIEHLFAQNDMLKVDLRSMAAIQAEVERFRGMLRLSGNAQFKDIWSEDDADEAPSGFLWDATKPGGGSSVGERLQSMREDLESASSRVLETTLHGKLVKRLQELPPEAFDELAWWFPEDEVMLEYRPAPGAGYKSIQQASAGQKTAAMLSFLLAHGEEPLLLDQPEDDLDNALVSQLVVSQLRQNKSRRQLVIITHNANIVVNGDAELVSTMKFAGGQINLGSSGGLQEESIRRDVCEVMEGGEEAFRQRYKRILEDLKELGR